MQMAFLSHGTPLPCPDITTGLPTGMLFNTIQPVVLESVKSWMDFKLPFLKKKIIYYYNMLSRKLVCVESWI